MFADFSSVGAPIQDLLKRAEEARRAAYSPYSGFQVGAALLCDDGEVFTGCNIENRSLSLTICAERVAYSKAISEGKTKFKAIAVVAHQEKSFTTPCGACRQFMSEWGNVDMYMSKPAPGPILVSSMDDMLPHQFEINPDFSFN